MQLETGEEHHSLLTLTVSVSFLLALDNVGLQETGNLLGMFDRRLNRRVGGGKCGIGPEALADRLSCAFKDSGVAWTVLERNTSGWFDFELKIQTFKRNPCCAHQVPVCLDGGHCEICPRCASMSSGLGP